jgi:hypothetical protein
MSTFMMPIQDLHTADEKVLSILWCRPGFVLFPLQKKVFSKEVYNKKDASPYEFDLVVNCDFIKEPLSVAEIILGAFRKKFGLAETVVRSGP